MTLLFPFSPQNERKNGAPKRMNNYQKNKERIKRLKLEGEKRRGETGGTCGTNETYEARGTRGTCERGESAPRERLPNLKKYALCIGYVGSRYHGCQGQGKDCMTIENEIERTLIRMNAVGRGGEDALKQNCCDFAAEQKSWDDILTVKEQKEELTEEELNAFFEIIQSYAGYHNFHCFTKNKVEQTTFRFIKYLDVSTVNLYNYNFVSVKILGQSFLMHQIRKMLTLAVETFRKATSVSSIYYCLRSGEYVPISLFPAEGLMLICPYFNAYNEKVCNPPQSPPICFEENEEVLNFKRDVVAKCIIEKMHTNVWKDWMLKMNKRPFAYHFMRDKLGDAKPTCERSDQV
ncbi:pseudouridylate synthase 1 [Plasmodium cynomolgi strain B]|uniref:tRNA pseudouridine synthase n=1 Tax=Plasmodium cynomolgi (strain B) TaxID=1120755 RepID=K6UHY6_PLACD|nr:pseudouridylate synthase 1 [Plasmodium cynomolgi strain B]GAB64493.1 pseudouridylate synthase 1 [Plasmodium cynomolgi strain B]